MVFFVEVGGYGVEVGFVLILISVGDVGFGIINWISCCVIGVILIKCNISLLIFNSCEWIIRVKSKY